MTALITGALKYRQLDQAMRVVVMMLLLVSIGELFSYAALVMKAYPTRNKIYHISCVVELFLISLFFICAVKPRHYYKLIVALAILWPALGVLNAVFLQPFHKLNNNILMLESFSTITMSLYFIYWLLKNDKVKSIFHYPHFWIAILWLLLWSGTFFFWAFVRILYSEHWAYFKIVDRAQNVINIITYAGIAAVLILYPKNLKTYENN